MTERKEISSTTAIVTCHNYGRYLPQCLDSLLNQTLPFKNIILVDDASDDETHDVWERQYQDRVGYARVDFGSQMKARHFGVEQTESSYIVCVDADDWLSATYHQRMIEPFLEDPEVGLAYCGMEIVREGDDHNWFPYTCHALIPFDPDLLWRQNYFSTAVMIRRSAWLGAEREYGVRFPNGKYALEDWDHWLEITGRGWTARLVSERLIFYRIHGQNTSRASFTGDTYDEDASRQVRQRHAHRFRASSKP
ncbi:MAG: glycosyltransferase [Candidatus Omnitrophota bacterium]|nr:glycosyltransferase [Candidatus Omnitrophota bacterium]